MSDAVLYTLAALSTIMTAAVLTMLWLM